MVTRKTITVSITPQQNAFVRERLRSGRFGSVSEVVRAALRLLEREEATLPESAVQLRARHE